jgi:hypothetical protein
MMHQPSLGVSHRMFCCKRGSQSRDGQVLGCWLARGGVPPCHLARRVLPESSAKLPLPVRGYYQPEQWPTGRLSLGRGGALRGVDSGPPRATAASDSESGPVRLLRAATRRSPRAASIRPARSRRSLPRRPLASRHYGTAASAAPAGRLPGTAASGVLTQSPLKPHKHDGTSELAQAALMGLSWPWILAG